MSPSRVIVIILNLSNKYLISFFFKLLFTKHLLFHDRNSDSKSDNENEKKWKGELKKNEIWAKLVVIYMFFGQSKKDWSQMLFEKDLEATL